MGSRTLFLLGKGEEMGGGDGEMPMSLSAHQAFYRKVGNLLLLGFLEEELDEICSLALEGRLGGVILFERNAGSAAQVASLAVRLMELPLEKRPILALDQEQGRICRIKSGVTLFPSHRSLGVLDRPRTTFYVARWTARELRRLGVNLNLAPVADVLGGEEARPLLEERCFGDDPQKVALHVGHWVRGSQEAGVAACAKHFPGHGSAKGDTHLEMSLDPSDAETIFRRHLVPFQEALKEKVASIMVSHVIYPALDFRFPASLSSKIMVDLLREKMGFKGMIITDDLEMKAIALKMDPVQAAVEAIRAGADMAIVSRNSFPRIPIKTIVNELEKAAAKGELPLRRLKESLSRVASFKRRWKGGSKEMVEDASFPGARKLARGLLEELSQWME